MPSFEGLLSRDEIATIVDWLRSHLEAPDGH